MGVAWREALWLGDVLEESRAHTSIRLPAVCLCSGPRRAEFLCQAWPFRRWRSQWPGGGRFLGCGFRFPQLDVWAGVFAAAPRKNTVGFIDWVYRKDRAQATGNIPVAGEVMAARYYRSKSSL